MDSKRSKTSDAMSVTQHLTELRRRVVRCLIAFFLSVGLCWYFSGPLLDLLKRPLLPFLVSHQFKIPHLIDGMIIDFKVAMLAGIILVSPYLAFEIWSFIAPGLHKREKKWVLLLSIASAFAFIVGIVFGYTVLFPRIVQFFAEYNAKNELGLDQQILPYFTFTIRLLLGFGLSFEFPVFLFLLSRVGLIQYRHLHKFRGYMIVLIFIAAGVLTPGPDVSLQVFVAIPLLILYEIGGLLVYFFGKKAS